MASLLFQILLSLLLIGNALAFQLSLSTNYGDKEIILSEIQLFNEGAPLPRDRISISFMGSEMDTFESEKCVDSSLASVCRISSVDMGIATTLTLDSNGMFFDEIVLHSVDGSIYGLTVSVSEDNGETVFWEHRIIDKRNIHVFDIHDAALAHYPVKIVSTFNYNGEPAALFHVQYLFRVVNQFIIVESLFTHSGTRKKQLDFETAENREAFAPYMSKIRYLVLESFPPRPPDFIETEKYHWAEVASYDAFWRDHYQRAYVQNFVDRSTKTLFLCVDADEIVDLQVVSRLRDEALYDSSVLSQRKIRFVMHMFYYNFLFNDQYTWSHAYAVTTDQFVNETDFVLTRTLAAIGDIGGAKDDYVIHNAGWHLSYFNSRQGIVRKVQSQAHRELDKSEFKTEEHVDACLREGKDLYARENHDLARLPLDKVGHLLPEGWEQLQDHMMRLQGLTK